MQEILAEIRHFEVAQCFADVIRVQPFSQFSDPMPDTMVLLRVNTEYHSMTRVYM